MPLVQCGGYLERNKLRCLIWSVASPGGSLFLSREWFLWGERHCATLLRENISAVA